MSVLGVASVPLLAIAAWVGWRALRGRPVRRFALNTVVGLTLLVYFAITAGLGIFWVANQELPAFDLHYLFGYLTLLLVATHVWINAPLLARFARRAVPALTAGGPRFRPSVAWGARLIGLAAFGSLCFWVGWSRGISVVTVVEGDQVRLPETAAAGMREQLVREHGRLVPLSRWYHRRSAHSRRGVVARGPRVDWDQRPSPFESYPSQATIVLPDEHQRVDLPTAAALDAAADATPALGAAPVTVAALGALLHLTQGITEVSGPPGQAFHKRAAASSGALYPVVTHVVVAAVDGIAPGLYHYAPRTHALHLLRAGDVRAELAATSARPEVIGRAPLALVFSTLYHRSSWKYGERGYRYCLLDTGHVLANAQAAGAGLGLASVAIGRFDDARVATLLGVELAAQGPMVIVPFGAPRDEAPGAVTGAAATEPAFVAVDRSAAAPGVPDAVRLVAGRTALALTGERAAPFAPAPSLPPRPPVDGDPIPLPAAATTGDALGPVIERRRSARRFGTEPLALPALAAVLDRARGGGLARQRAVRIHVIANHVAGLAPGVYELRSAERALSPVRRGDVREAAYEMALSQEVVERAAAIVVLTADVATMSWPDGSRGLRTAWIDAGVAAGRMYLQAVALGLGVSSVGAFFDDEVVDLLDLDGAVELPVLLVALGTRA